MEMNEAHAKRSNLQQANAQQIHHVIRLCPPSASDTYISHAYHGQLYFRFFVWLGACVWWAGAALPAFAVSVSAA